MSYFNRHSSIMENKLNKMNNLDISYQQLLQHIIVNGVDKEDRTGTGTKSVFGAMFFHDMEEGFPLLTTKKMAVKTMITELKWFLKGDTNIKYLLENNCHIWSGDAYKAYERVHHWELEDPDYDLKEFEQKILSDDDFAKQWGNLGFIYGKQWRDADGVDQIQELINNIKTNPTSRRLIVNAWNVNDLKHMVLPPCHYGFQCYVADGKLSLMWSQRSVDTFLGLPFNIASYGLLLLLLCEETGLEPGTLLGSLGDVHLYNNHLDQAHQQIRLSPYDLPTMKVSNVDILNGEFDWELIDYESHPTIKAPLSN
jgi:thymidylate synthase